MFSMMYKLLALPILCSVLVSAQITVNKDGLTIEEINCTVTKQYNSQIPVDVSLSGNTASVSFPLLIGPSPVTVSLEISPSNDLTTFDVVLSPIISGSNSKIEFDFNIITSVFDIQKCLKYTFVDAPTKTWLNVCSQVYSIRYSKTAISGCFFIGGGALVSSSGKVGNATVASNGTVASVVDIGCYNATNSDIKYTDDVNTQASLKDLMHGITKPLDKICNSASALYPFTLPVIVLLVKFFLSEFFFQNPS